MPVDALPHEVVVEGTRPSRPIDAAEIGRKARIARDRNLIPALLPQQKLQQTLDVPVVGSKMGGVMGKNTSAEDRRRTVASLESEGDLRAANGFDRGAVSAIPQ
jgi:hypothetical protein